MDPQSKILICWICLQVIFASVSSDVWKAEVVSPVEALVSSCVVLPCKFNYPGPTLPSSRVKGIWHLSKEKDKRIYDEDKTFVIDSFKDRTKLIGQLGEKNCSLEIDNVKDHDNGPFCFRAEIPTLDKYSFEEACVKVNMKTKPDKPILDIQESLVEETPAIFKCYVRHTCPTHHPTIEWSHVDVQPRLVYKDIGHGVWEVESLLPFTPKEKDDHSDITCTVTFHDNLRSEDTCKIYVKRKENFFHIIIPVTAVLGTIILFGTGCFFITRKYKKNIQELQARNQNGVWGRLSRMSHRSYGRRQTPERSVPTKSNNCESSVSGTAGFSKARFPSPKSQKKSNNKSDGGNSAGDDVYTNRGDNVYGNI